LLLLWLAFKDVNFSKVGEGLRKANYYWLLLSLLFALLAYISRARRWVLLINPLGYKPSLKNSFYAMMTGYLANIALPRVGEISKCVALGKKEEIPVDQLIGTVVIERTIDFFSLVIIMILMVIIDGKIVGPFLVDNIYLNIQNKLAAIFGAAWIFWLALAFAGFLVLFLIIRYKEKLRKIRFFSKLFDIAKGVIQGLKTITIIERKWEFIFHTIFIWLCYTLMTWVVVFTIESTSGLDFSDSIFLLVVGGLAMTAPVQSGMGAFHLTMQLALYVVYGISKEDGLIYAILSHESQMLFGIILGTYSFYALLKKKPPIPPEGGLNHSQD
jgi:hypothetical protein